MKGMIRSLVLLLAAAIAGAVPARAAEALVAVASNFAEAAERLQAGFEAESGHKLIVTTGATGKLYAQIVAGAPFDVMLSADQARAVRLGDEGFAVADARFTYAIGRLTLWSPDPARTPADGRALLAAGDFRNIAIANPDLAPYGAAAREALQAMGLWETLRDRIVMGENIGQTFAMVATRNADLGLVALSYVLSPRNAETGSRWDVPQDLYAPIRQDAALMTRAADNPAARGFLAYLRSDAARAMIEAAGYGVE